MNRPRLRVLIVAADPGDAEFACRVLEDAGDWVETARDVPEALGRLGQTHFELALVSLSLPRGDGLALVHHLMALHPGIDLSVMFKPDEVEDASSALALGVLSTIATPLTGDEILVSADRARERRALIAERQRLLEQAASLSPNRTLELAHAATAFVGETDVTRCAEAILRVAVGNMPVIAGALYVSEGSSGDFVRVAAVGDPAALVSHLPAQGGATMPEIEPFIEEAGEVQALLKREDLVVGRLWLKRHEACSLGTDDRARLHFVVSLAGPALAAARHTGAIQRGGIKDPDTGAYTFVCFGDLATREIERAHRHHRSFGLLTLRMAGVGALSSRLERSELTSLRRAVTQAVLGAVRESDVVARVDDDEHYVLLSETSLLGALSCKRRVCERLDVLTPQLGGLSDATRTEVEALLKTASVGVSVFPADGQDLGELIKLSRRRSEQTRHGAWQRFGLSSKPFWDSVEQLLDSEQKTEDDVLGAHVRLPQSAVTAISLGLLRDAERERILGTLYLAGDPDMSAQVARQVFAQPELRLRTWLLGPAASVRDPAADIRLPLSDARLKTASMILWLTERGGYCLLGRRAPDGQVDAYHSSDTDLVEGLVYALQSTYHLQPELR